MTPLERYEAELSSGRLAPDASQAALVVETERLYQELIAPVESPRGWLAGLRGALGTVPRRAAVRGLYLWGGVGRGKTHFMNQFFESLPFEDKRRQHFHGFMRYLHGELRELGGRHDPLKVLAQGLSEQIRLLCLDEFHVADITDAMLLGRLLSALFERGVTLVTTSNIAPDDLYRGGLQGQGFLPAIEAIKRHTLVMQVASPTDYRLRVLSRAPTYHTPLDARAEGAMWECFEALEPENVREGLALAVEGRQIVTRRCADGIVWFDFRELCGQGRAAPDYIEIARQFHTVLVSNVPVMGDGRNDEALRFVHLIDEFYDRRVNLVLSAAAPAPLLYPSGRLELQFARSASRLQEMQSMEYLAAKHLP